MYILNTTFNIDLSVSDNFIKTIEENILPKLAQTKIFIKSVFCEVSAEAYSEGKTFSLQLFYDSKTHLSQFKNFHNFQITDLVQAYEGKLVYFQTELKVVSIETY